LGNVLNNRRGIEKTIMKHFIQLSALLAPESRWNLKLSAAEARILDKMSRNSQTPRQAATVMSASDLLAFFGLARAEPGRCLGCEPFPGELLSPIDDSKLLTLQDQQEIRLGLAKGCYVTGSSFTIASHAKQANRLCILDAVLTSKCWGRSDRSSFVLAQFGGIDVPGQVQRFVAVSVTVSIGPAPGESRESSHDSKDGRKRKLAPGGDEASKKRAVTLVHTLANVRWFKRSKREEWLGAGQYSWLAAEHDIMGYLQWIPVHRIVSRFVPAYLDDDKKRKSFTVVPLPFHLDI
jgi:hypothetical protein